MFINKLTTGGKLTDTRHTDELQGIPEVTDLPDATHSAQISINIINIKDRQVSVLVNDVIQEEFLSDEDQSDVSITLDEGDNILAVESKDTETKEVKKSQNYRIAYIESKPELTITSPTDGTVTDKQDITITGTVGSDISVQVNNQPVVVSANGSFTTSVKLTNGENTISVVAQNAAGATETQTVTVSYEP